MNPGLYNMNDNLISDWKTLVDNYGLNVERNWYDPCFRDYIEDFWNDLNPGGILDTNFEETDLKLILPDGIEKITNGSFTYSDTLVLIYIPEGVKIIENGAFNDCTKLKEIYIPDTIEKINREMFFGSEQAIIFYKGKKYSYIDLQEYEEFY